MTNDDDSHDCERVVTRNVWIGLGMVILDDGSLRVFVSSTFAPFRYCIVLSPLLLADVS